MNDWKKITPLRDKEVRSTEDKILDNTNIYGNKTEKLSLKGDEVGAINVKEKKKRTTSERPGVKKE